SFEQSHHRAHRRAAPAAGQMDRDHGADPDLSQPAEPETVRRAQQWIHVPRIRLDQQLEANTEAAGLGCGRSHDARGHALAGPHRRRRILQRRLEIVLDLSLEECLRRIAELEGEVRAWAVVRPQPNSTAGLLSGVPYGAKDIIDTAGLPTEYG